MAFPMPCLSANQISEYIEGVLPEDERERVEEELASCDDCRALLCDWAQATLHSLPADPPPESDSDSPGALHRSGDTLSQYELLEYLGAGGMGMVFSARDPTLDRVVAIKVVHPQLLASEGAADALLREAKAMAAVRHPHVVQVYAAGTADNVAFIAMENVGGAPLPTWIKESKDPSQTPELFLGLASGLAAIHDAGFVHRDVKPANVLVERDGTAKLSDFGLASAATGGPGGGTPAYMAPELGTGAEASAASDQYSFALTLKHCWHQPPKAVARVVAKGLADDPSARFPSMHAFAQALAKATRPRPWNAIAAGATVAGVAGALAFVLQSDGSNASEACKREVAKAPRIWSEAARDAARTSFEASGRAWWERAFSRIDTAMRSAEDSLTTHSQRACVERRRGEAERSQNVGVCLERVRGALSGTANVLAHADTQVVDASATIADSLGAAEHCHSAVPQSAEGTPIAARISEAEILNASGKYSEATRLLREVEPLAKAVHEPELLARLYRALATSARRRQRYSESREELKHAARASTALGEPQLLARIHIDLALITGYYQDEAAAAEVHLETATSVLAKAPSPELLAKLEDTRGLVASNRGAYAEAIAHFERSLAIHTERGDALGRAESLYFRGLVGRNLPHEQRFLDGLYESLEIRRKELGLRHPDVFRVYGAIGMLESRGGDQEAALRWYEKAAEETEESLGPLAADLGGALNSLGAQYISHGEYDKAEETLQRALRIRREVLESDDVDLERTLVNLASLNYYRGQPAKAAEYYEEALAIGTAAFGSDHPEVGVVAGGLGLAALAAGDVERGRRHLTRSVAIGRAHKSSRLADSVGNLALLEATAENWDRAYELASEALSLQEAELPKDHPNLAYSFGLLSEIALEQGQLERAEKHARRALELRRAAGIAAQLTAENEFVLAKIYWAQGKRKEAKSLAESALEHLGKERPDLASLIRAWQRSPSAN